MKSFFLFPILVFLISCTIKETSLPEQWIATAPAGNQYTGIDKEGATIIPNGRLITPLGKQITVAPHPFGLALSPDGQVIITSNSGTGPFSISLIHHFNTASPTVDQIPEGVKPDKGLLEAVFMGLAISPDNRLVYVAGGQENKIHIFNVETGKKEGEIPCQVSFDGTDYNDGYIGDMALSKDGSRLYAVDQIGFRMVIVDTKIRKVVGNVKTGRYPFGIALSPDEKSAFVVNIGMFEYHYVKTLDRKRLNETALRFPAFAYGSPEMKTGIKNDTLEITGLGAMDDPSSFSVWRIALDQERPVVTAKIKTGIQVGESLDGIPAVGGSSPNSLVANDRHVFVTNGNNDNISVIDLANNNIITSIDLTLDKRLGNLKGINPFGLALSPDQKRLYVAESGINAVAVIDVPTSKVIGHIPTGWFPAKIKVTPDGKQLIVANAKGYGSGPNGGVTFTPGPEGDFIGSLMKGTVSVMDIPNDGELPALTEKVIANNFHFDRVNIQPDNPIPIYPGAMASPIKFIVFISKENRTFDQVFGQLPQAKGDSTIARYGIGRTVVNKKGDLKVENVNVMPNHQALARQFNTSDNFYVDSDVSADGHVWLVNTYPNQWMETLHPANSKRQVKESSNAPGKFGMTGAAGAIFPEDYNQHGSLWEHLHRHGIDFYNFGFGTEFGTGNFTDSTFIYGGVRYLVNYPLPAPLYDRTSRIFPNYNTMIPDQYRADLFIREVKEKWLDHSNDLPPLITLQLLNDHGAGERTHAGFPFRESYMADNDLALGRVVDFLSHTPFWKNMLIVVTEDDAQDGTDHIDAHRSLLLVISPYAKKTSVSHRHVSFGSIFKTFWNILDIPYLNQYDFSANDLSDCFTSTPDFTPYTALPSDLRIFDPQKAFDPFDDEFDWNALSDSPRLDDPNDIKKEREEIKKASTH